jgi:hypothetical protein
MMPAPLTPAIRTSTITCMRTSAAASAGDCLLNVAHPPHGKVSSVRLAQHPRTALHTARDWARRMPRVLTAVTPASMLGVYLIALVLLLAADHLCYLAARLPVRIYIASRSLTVGVDGQSLAAAWTSPPTAVRLVSGSAMRREYQIDGTDSTNNFTEDDATLAALATNPYYQFQAWMRDNPTYSAWTDIRLTDARTGRVLSHVDTVPTGQSVTLPLGAGAVLTANLERPESPVQIDFLAGDAPVATVFLDRNDRALSLFGLALTPGNATTFFPEQPLPFAGEVADILTRVAIWAVLLLGGTTALSFAAIPLAIAAARIRPATGARRAPAEVTAPAQADPLGIAYARRDAARVIPAVRLIVRQTRRLLPHRGTPSPSPHPADLLVAGTLLGSFAFVIYIALAQYHAMPHILDASAYYFQAKIFASGRLAAPAPAPADRLAAFQGPFMVAWHGRWFAQYPPATSALLALGFVLHIPWLIEPVVATAALLGIYHLGRMLYGPWVAAQAVLLLALSPFYSYLAAAYLSHPIALCAVVYFLLFLLRFADHHRLRDLMAAAAALTLLLFTRELTAVLVAGIGSVWVIRWHGRALWHDRARTIPALLVGCAIVWFGVLAYLLYNALQTGDPLLLPRTLFFPGDVYGFGAGVGFYGRHTLAAGLVNLDEQLTALLIDLFGWPFYLTLALIPLALLHRDAARRWDRFCLSFVLVLTASQVGYFYHGIYLGPRYLYETLPFLALLTARGITALTAFTVRALSALLSGAGAHGRARAARVAVAVVVGGLVLCDLLFYMPRQLAQHQNFTGLPVTSPVDVTAIYALHPHHALLVTYDVALYNNVLWPLNDPDLGGDVLYALVRAPRDVATLRAVYPDRTLYEVVVDARGRVSLVPITSVLPSGEGLTAGGGA